jgi:cyclophilin family peptidyl-prolyl cis-trans isomerase
MLHGSKLLISMSPLFDQLPQAVVFGRVVEGMDVALKLEQGDLLEQVKILSQRNHSYDASGTRVAR